MKILIDIGHPAHVHLFKNFAWIMQNKGHKIFFTCREKEHIIYLLDGYGFQYKCFGKKYSSYAGKLFGLLKYDVLEFIEGMKFKPDIYLSAGSIYAAHASYFQKKPHITLEDTGNMEQIKLYLPFTKYVLTSTSFHKNLGKKQIRYNSYHELAYLHPQYFSPDPDIQYYLGLNSKEKYAVVRFVRWAASHDRNINGLSLQNKIEIVNNLSKYAKVFISSEDEIPEELEKYKINVKPDKMHDVLSSASLLFGESGTMTSECAVLGTPAIQISGLPKGTMGVLREQEEYGLVKVYERYSVDILEEAIDMILEDKYLKTRKLREHIMREKVDLTEYLINFVTNLK